MEIAIAGEGELVIRYIDKDGRTLMQERLTVSGLPSMEARHLAPLALQTVDGSADVAPVLGYACREAPGFHWADDHFLIEAVHPESGQTVQPGIPGRLVVTDLTREGSPLIRYRSDLETVLIDEPCPCRRTSMRAMSVRSLA